MRRPAIPQPDALRLQLAAIGGDEPDTSFIEVRPLDPPGRQGFVPVRKLEVAVALVEQLAAKHNVYVGAAPRVRPSGKAQDVERVWCLWADCDTPEAVDQLRRFHPLPSIVVRSGTDGHLHGWWPLSRPISPSHAVRANRRVALALGADRASTDAARIMRPAGSRNHKTEPPRAVECVRLELDTFRIADVVHGLPDDPAYTRRPEAKRNVRVAKWQHRRSAGPEALAGLARLVRESPIGDRNHRLNWAAFRAGEHMAAGAINTSDAESELLAAAVEVGLDEREALRTIASGLSAVGRRTA